MEDVAIIEKIIFLSNTLNILEILVKFLILILREFIQSGTISIPFFINPISSKHDTSIWKLQVN